MMGDSSGGVAPVGPSHQSSLFNPDSFGVRAELKGLAQEFGQGFADGAQFTMAVAGFGVNLVKQGAAGQVKSQFG